MLSARPKVYIIVDYNGRAPNKINEISERAAHLYAVNSKFGVEILCAGKSIDFFNEAYNKDSKYLQYCIAQWLISLCHYDKKQHVIDAVHVGNCPKWVREIHIITSGSFLKDVLEGNNPCNFPENIPIKFYKFHGDEQGNRYFTRFLDKFNDKFGLSVYNLESKEFLVKTRIHDQVKLYLIGMSDDSTDEEYLVYFKSLDEAASTSINIKTSNLCEINSSESEKSNYFLAPICALEKKFDINSANMSAEQQRLGDTLDLKEHILILCKNHKDFQFTENGILFSLNIVTDDLDKSLAQIEYLVSEKNCLYLPEDNLSSIRDLGVDRNFNHQQLNSSSQDLSKIFKCQRCLSSWLETKSKIDQLRDNQYSKSNDDLANFMDRKSKSSSKISLNSDKKQKQPWRYWGKKSIPGILDRNWNEPYRDPETYYKVIETDPIPVRSDSSTKSYESIFRSVSSSQLRSMEQPMQRYMHDSSEMRRVLYQPKPDRKT